MIFAAGSVAAQTPTGVGLKAEIQEGWLASNVALAATSLLATQGPQRSSTAQDRVRQAREPKKAR